MRRALITGASGFIGHHLAMTLRDRGDDVVALVRPSSDTSRLAALGVELVVGDVTNAASLRHCLRGIDVVYHLAGLTKALHRRQLYAVNEVGTRNVAAECAARSAPPCLIHVSSLAAAGPALYGVPSQETDAAQPVSNYGRSKRAGELALYPFAKQLPVTIVRPPIVFGEGDPATLAMFRAIKYSWIHTVPGILPKRFSLIHARDLAELLVSAAERGERLPRDENDARNNGQGVYYADCGLQPTYYQLGQLIGQALGRPFTACLPVPNLGVWGVSAVTESVARLFGRSVYLSLDKAREATAGSWICSAEKAHRQLGFRVSSPLLDQLHVTARWYREQGWL